MEFSPFESSVNLSFWNKYTELKIDVDKLNVENRKIWGYYSNHLSLCKQILEVDSTSFNSDFNMKDHLPFYGTLINKNTIEEFKECNKTEVIQNVGNIIWNHIENGEAVKNPALLNRFLILSFADLKKYHYYYWFAFPTAANINVELIEAVPITSAFETNEVQTIFTDYNLLNFCDKTFFVILKSNSQLKICTFCSFLNLKSKHFKEVYFGFSDPSKEPSNPSWLLKNYLLLLLYNCPSMMEQNINVLALRIHREDKCLKPDSSRIFTIKLANLNESLKDAIYNIEGGSWIGWERNERNKMGPRFSNMKNSLDPKYLAKSAVDLNLKLMKWRILPDINLETIKNTKCLLLGSGTLGCSVARNLLAWGVHKITFVDNSTVSYSNPVRQSLFTYEDCIQNISKAKAAASNLKKIYPEVESEGFDLNIPMPGHPIGEGLLDKIKENLEELQNLISEHDVIFLLMDSRESRWLPTLLGSYFKKIVINAALGFDTYLVMRHGMKSIKNVPYVSSYPKGLKVIQGCDLGCYFCNDVTAPGDSLKDRTLDQQCTVTRPGVSNIAGSLAVELLVSILQNENGAYAPAFYKVAKYNHEVDIPSESLLGIIPHSIRGFLCTFNHVLPATEKYEKCVACSNVILEAYERNGFQFLLEVFNSSRYLEKITGLDNLFNENIEILNFSDSDEITE